MMLRFALFTGYAYYPSGGWEDFQGTYATLEEAMAAAHADFAKGKGERWYHVVDLSNGTIVAQD